jgi:hypothetical protein
MYYLRSLYKILIKKKKKKKRGAPDGPKRTGDSNTDKNPSGGYRASKNHNNWLGNGGCPNGNGALSSGCGNCSTQNEKSVAKISDKEHNKLLASGKCFRCKEAGHLSQNCPHGNSVQTGHSNRPPGLTLSSIGVNLVEVKQLQDLAETTESVDNIKINMLLLDMYPDLPLYWDTDPTVWQHPCNGDFMAQRVVAILGKMAPYPFDGCSTLVGSEPCFHVFQLSGGLHGIFDFECLLLSTEAISTSLLFEEDFNLPAWYADRQAFHNNAVLPDDHDWLDSPWMGDVLALGAAFAICKGINEYPAFVVNHHHEEQWTVEWSPFGYCIVGGVLKSAVHVLQDQLLDQSFDLISWYHGKVMIHRDCVAEVPCWDDCPECVVAGPNSMDRLPHYVGDFRGQAAAALLNACQPYLGDPPGIGHKPN